MKINQRTLIHFFALSAVIFFSALQVVAQSPMVKEQTTLCKIKVNTLQQQLKASKEGPITTQAKTYDMKLSQTGFFNRVSHIQPMQTVQIELYYPEGKPGEKVSLMVMDGGTLDNGKKVKVVQLDKELKFSFGFQAGQNLGIYRVILRKGFDSKVVQLWVGEEEKITRN